MSIDLTEPIAAGHHLADTVRRRTGESVDAVRDVDLHLPIAAAETVIAAATHRARRARKHAKRAARDTRRSIETKVDHGSRRVQQHTAHMTEQATRPRVRVWIIGALLVGAAGAIGVLAMKRQRSQQQAAFEPSSTSELPPNLRNGSVSGSLSQNDVITAP